MEKHQAYPDLARFLNHLHFFLVVPVVGDGGVMGEQVKGVLQTPSSTPSGIATYHAFPFSQILALPLVASLCLPLPRSLSKAAQILVRDIGRRDGLKDGTT